MKLYSHFSLHVSVRQPEHWRIESWCFHAAVTSCRLLSVVVFYSSLLVGAHDVDPVVHILSVRFGIFYSLLIS